MYLKYFYLKHSIANTNVFCISPECMYLFRFVFKRKSIMYFVFKKVESILYFLIQIMRLIVIILVFEI